MSNQTASTIASPAAPTRQFTECPNCETVFRVTAEQLQIAGGQVRCGSCLHVFVAAEHWANSEAPGGKPANPPSVLVASERGSRPDDPAGSASEAEPTLPATALKQRATIEFSEAFMALETPDSPACPLEDSGSDDNDPEDEEDWALQMLEAEAAAEPAPGKRTLQAIREQPEPPSPRPDKVAQTPAPDNDGSRKYETGEFEATESWMQELLDTKEPEDCAFDAPLQPAAATAAAALVPGAEPDEEYVPEIFRANSALLEGIPAEPVEMHWRRHISPGVRHGLILVGITVAALLLVAQYLWFNAGHLAANPKYRPLVAHFCQISGCTMPSRIDISRIKNSNLVVLQHPRVEGALLLDTILTNHAGYEQPFPVLYVRFSNLQDQTVAARAFTPAEYLGGDMVGASMMPVRQPIHLSLELRDPGEEASNYRVQLLPADRQYPSL